MSFEADEYKEKFSFTYENNVFEICFETRFTNWCFHAEKTFFAEMW